MQILFTEIYGLYLSTRNVSIILLIITVILSIILTGALVRFIGEPVRQLVRAAKQVAEGDFSHRINICSRDEIGILAETFNQMTTSLECQSSEIEKQQLELVAKNNQLEQKTLTLESQKNEIEQKNFVLEDTMQKLNDAHQQLVMQEKMASLGNLVAGVAHEINNPVGAINSAADVSMRAINNIEKSLSSEISPEDIQLQKAMRILKENNSIALTASKRVVNIVKTLKNFARLDEAEYQKVDIREGIESTLTLVNHKLKNRINVVKEYGNIPAIDCYPNQLNQVFMNLFVNAAQAIENEGTITIKTYIEKNHVCIDITDTGKGIPKNEIAYIFDPGFTTKGVGVGTGLGLSISYNIIQKHNGEIKAESKPGEGTTFTIVLPLN